MVKRLHALKCKNDTVTTKPRCPVCLQGGGNPLEWFAKLNPFDKQRRDGEDELRDERESITGCLLEHENARLVKDLRKVLSCILVGNHVVKSQHPLKLC